jgi:release factor glutamine methyltransferase
MTPTHSIAEILAGAARELQACSDSPRLDAELLLGQVLGHGRSALIAHAAEQVADGSRRDYQALIDRRRHGAPVAYLIGRREFWSLSLAVTPAVLVPRPETETLVEAALAAIPPDRVCRVLDLGTGSGAIALAIAEERPLAAVTGTDLSPEALQVALANARALGMTRIAWRLGDWFDAVPGERFDLIVANPPYIAAADPHLTALHAEPTLALTPGPSGLEALAAIAARAAGFLNRGGQLVLEHGASQADEVAALLEHHGFTGLRSYPDISGRPRVAAATVHSPT